MALNITLYAGSLGSSFGWSGFFLFFLAGGGGEGVVVVCFFIIIIIIIIIIFMIFVSSFVFPLFPLLTPYLSFTSFYDTRISRY